MEYRVDFNHIRKFQLVSIRRDNLFNLIRAGVLLIKFLNRLFYVQIFCIQLDKVTNLVGYVRKTGSGAGNLVSLNVFLGPGLAFRHISRPLRARGQLSAILADPLGPGASFLPYQLTPQSYTLAYGYKINIVTIIAFIAIRVLKS